MCLFRKLQNLVTKKYKLFAFENDCFSFLLKCHVDIHVTWPFMHETKLKGEADYQLPQIVITD